MPEIIGCDVGGTFTDLVLVDREGTDTRVQVAKVPTTLDNQAGGVMDAISAAGAELPRVSTIVHGTTTTTNAVLERKRAKTGLITTQGFRDVLERGRRTRPQAYGLIGTFTPLVPRTLRLEVPERLNAQGEVITPLDEAAVREAAQQLLAQDGESVVVHFLHSYAYDAHEARACEIIAEMWPNAFITRGSAILSEFREYERGVTASVNASVQPILYRYIDRLETRLKEGGYHKDLLVMQGNGGTIAASHVAEEAVKTVMSGPASGVMAAAYTASQSGYPNVITYDMGGTSSDVGLIWDGVPQVSSELALEYAMPIHVPMVDVHTIGAGGGSLAFVNEAGLLQVGPESAGATPGPICYGRGGTRPTITDANLLLGRLDGQKLLSVDSAVSQGDIEDAVKREIGDKLGLSPIEAAEAVIRIANDKMAGAVRMVSLSRGHDPRDFMLFAFGGAGPLHAVALARELGIPKVLIPARPGITNALGCVVADLRHDFVNTVNTPLNQLSDEDVSSVFQRQIASGDAAVERDGVAIESKMFLHRADMQFRGQSHILSVAVPDPDITLDELQERFLAAYYERFAVELPGLVPVLVNLHTAIIGRRESIDLSKLLDAKRRATNPIDALTETRRVVFGGSFTETAIYDRERLPLGVEIAGPAVIEQMDSTIVIDPDASVQADTLGNLVVTLGKNSGNGGVNS